MTSTGISAAIANVGENTSVGELVEIAEQCESVVDSELSEILESIEGALSIAAPTSGKQCLKLWILIDRLSKQHVPFLDTVRPELLRLALKYHPQPAISTEAYQEFLLLLERSFSILYGAPLVTLIRLQLPASAFNEGEEPNSALSTTGTTSSSWMGLSTSSAVSSSSSLAEKSATCPTSVSSSLALSTYPSSVKALGDSRSALQTIGGFITKSNASGRDERKKHSLQVKTVDSLMAMNVASSYAPTRPVEIVTPHYPLPEPDTPRGFMKPLPSDHTQNYQEARRKRLREIMEKNKETHDSREEHRLLQRVRQETQGGIDVREGAQREWGDGKDKPPLPQEDRERDATEFPGGRKSNFTSTSYGLSPRNLEYDDLQMPLEFPRDEFGVKIGNFPLGVRFLRDAIKACGGAVELEVLSHRVSTLASREAVANFGNIREFLRIHSPTFRLQLEKGIWIVRLNESSSHRGVSKVHSEEELPTWESMQCPHCSKLLKGRNFARHQHCRACITAQIALGLHGDYMDRGPIAALAHCAKRIISLHQQEAQAKNSTLEGGRGVPKTEGYVELDDGDVDMLAECLQESAEVHRFRLASPRQFAPILKAIGIVRDRWLAQKGVSEMDEAIISNDDLSVANLFSILGGNIHRLPIPWIEMGDVIDMCHRFSKRVLPPFNPPPRPADPRISLYNEYPGFLLCESEVDDEDDPSGDEAEFSDEDDPSFTFTPPVDVAEAIFTAGFPRDTKRLQHRMRTAPPLVLQRVLKSDGNMTQREMYAASRTAFRTAVAPIGGRGQGGRR